LKNQNKTKSNSISLSPSSLLSPSRTNTIMKSSIHNNNNNNNNNNNTGNRNDKSNNGSNTKNNNTHNNNIPKYLDIIMSFAYIERLREADNIIFQEEVYLKYLEKRKIRDVAAIKIQTCWRGYTARKYLRKLRKETNKAMNYNRQQFTNANINNFYSSSISANKKTNENYSQLYEKIEKLTENDLQKELEKIKAIPNLKTYKKFKNTTNK
jgi:D-mannonate dehydratase